MNAYELADEMQIVEDKAEAHAMGHIRSTVADAKVILRQQADRIAELEKENSNFKYEISSSAWQPKEATDQELFNIYAHLQDTYEGDNFPVALGRTILKLYTTQQTKPLSDEEMNKAFEYYCETDEGVLRFDYELREEWKKEQLIRWKQAFDRAIEAKVRGH